MHSFATPGKVRVIIYNPSDTIDITADDTATTTVELTERGSEGAAMAELTTVTSSEAAGEHVVTVTMPGSRSFSRRRAGLGVRITVPTGADVTVTTDGSERSVFSITRGRGGDIQLHGTFGNVDIATISGDVTTGTVTGTLTVKTTSGDVKTASVHGRLRVSCVSGDISIEDAHADVTIKVVSGDVTVTSVDRQIDVTSVSGDIMISDAKLGASCTSTSGDLTIRRAWNGSISVTTVSGDVSIGVPPGRGVSVEARSMSGDLSSEIDLESDEMPAETDGSIVRINARSVSGDVKIQRAAHASA